MTRMQWVYEGDAGARGHRADDGGLRAAHAAGLQAQPGARRSRLEPKPKIFGKNTVIQGWGVPDAIADNKDGTSTLHLRRPACSSIFDKEGDGRRARMTFTVPQPLAPPAPPAAPKR